MEGFHMKTFGLLIFACIIIIRSLSCVWPFATHGLQHTRLPCPSFSWRLFKLMSIESVMPSNHLILCCPHSPPAFNLPQHQGLFQWVGSLSQPKHWNFSFSISSSNEYSGLISLENRQIQKYRYNWEKTKDIFLTPRFFYRNQWSTIIHNFSN